MKIRLSRFLTLILILTGTAVASAQIPSQTGEREQDSNSPNPEKSAGEKLPSIHHEVTVNGGKLFLLSFPRVAPTRIGDSVAESY